MRRGSWGWRGGDDGGLLWVVVDEKPVRREARICLTPRRGGWGVRFLDLDCAFKKGGGKTARDDDDDNRDPRQNRGFYRNSSDIPDQDSSPPPRRAPSRPPPPW